MGLFLFSGLQQSATVFDVVWHLSVTGLGMGMFQSPNNSTVMGNVLPWQLGIASGILAGLVAVTPAAGVVQPYGALILGAAASIVCYLAILLKNRVGYDDSLDAFGIHGIGGIIGAIFLTFFIRRSWMDEAAMAAGGSWNIAQQLGIQVTAVLVAIVYAAVLTLLLLVIVQKVIGLRMKDADEMQGMDFSIHGEHGYGMVNAG